MDPLVHVTDECQCIGLWYNVALIDTAGETGAEQMRAIGDAYRELARSYSRVVGLCVARPEASLGTQESREEAALFVKELGPALAHIAIVIEADGVVAQMFRSAMRAFSVFIRHPPISVHRTLDEALGVLAPMIQSPLPPDRAASEARAAFVGLRGFYNVRKGMRPLDYLAR